MLGQVDSLEILAIIDIVQSHIEGDKRVEIYFFKLIDRLFYCIDGSCDTLLFPIESTQSALRL